MSEEERASREYNLNELKNEFRIIKDDVEKIKDALDEFMKSGTANERQDFDHLLKKVKFLLKDIQDTKKWFLYHKKRNWED